MSTAQAREAFRAHEEANAFVWTPDPADAAEERATAAHETPVKLLRDDDDGPFIVTFVLKVCGLLLNVVSGAD